MSNKLDEILAQLHKTYESGDLDENNYHIVIAALKANILSSPNVSGSGALAQLGGVAAGIGGIAVGGNVHGNIYMSHPTDDPIAALDIYRNAFIANCRQVSLRGIDTDVSDPSGSRKRLNLDQIYVALDTTNDQNDKRGDRPRAKDRPLSLLDASIKHRHVVILGPPGSGKSTFLNYLGLCLALHGLYPTQNWLQYLPNWPQADVDLIPITVRLRDFAHSFTTPSDLIPPHHYLWQFIEKQLQMQDMNFVTPLIQSRLQQGQTIVLLDGLDEISTQHQQSFVRDAVTSFAQRYPHSRLMITCRTLPYQDPVRHLAGFPTIAVAEFDDPKIKRFIATWYTELVQIGVVKAAEAPGLIQRLQTAVQRPDLRCLASNPLLLTVMALVHTHKGRLPNARALLYEETIDILLLRWEDIKTGDNAEALSLRRLLAAVGRSAVDLKRVLWEQAFKAHERGNTGTVEALADIGELQLEKALAGLHPEKSRDWANSLIEMMKLRSGLLLERAPEIYTFPHRTFQEYLAGAYLSTQANFASRGGHLLQDGTSWRQVILSAVGRLVHLSGDLDKPLALIGELCPEAKPQTELAWRQVWLASEVLEEIGFQRVQDSALGQDLLARVRQRLAYLISISVLTPVERATAACTLGRLGDPRPGVGVKTDLPDIEWVIIEAGDFIMGGDDIYDGKPQFICTLIRQPYRISRYPITVAQYQTFVNAKGYEKQEYWTEAGWRWRIENGITSPEAYEDIYQTPNHPQVGVSWYEAMSFCCWLMEQISGKICLPSESQWEKACRDTEGRTYPWGDKGDPAQYCNMNDTDIHSTSAVGIFPEGNTLNGIADMAGNVWEWCSTWWLDNYERYEEKENNQLLSSTRYVLRGGSFINYQINVHCASRFRLHQESRSRDIGFRIVSELPPSATAQQKRY